MNSIVLKIAKASAVKIEAFGCSLNNKDKLREGQYMAEPTLSRSLDFEPSV